MNSKLSAVMLKQVRRAISLYPCLSLPEASVAQCGENISLHDFFLRVKGECSVCPMLWLFGELPRAPISVLSDPGCWHGVGILVHWMPGGGWEQGWGGAFCCRTRELAVPQTDARGSKRLWAPELNVENLWDMADTDQKRHITPKVSEVPGHSSEATLASAFPYSKLEKDREKWLGCRGMDPNTELCHMKKQGNMA